MKRIERNSSTGHRECGCECSLSKKPAVEESRIMQYLSCPFAWGLWSLWVDTDRYTTEKQSWHLCACCVEVCSAVCTQIGTLKDNYILFPSIKLNCPNNGMACSQQYCCVLLQTIIELTVHFFSGGWNIKFDLILVLMLLHFASLTVFLDDRGICDHSTMTWEPQLWQEIAFVMGLEHVLQNITQCKSRKMGQTDRTQTHEWQVTLNSLSHWKCCGLKSLSCNFSIKILPFLDFG